METLNEPNAQIDYLSLVRKIEALLIRQVPDGNETSDYAYELRDMVRQLLSSMRDQQSIWNTNQLALELTIDHRY